MPPKDPPKSAAQVLALNPALQSAAHELVLALAAADWQDLVSKDAMVVELTFTSPAAKASTMPLVHALESACAVFVVAECLEHNKRLAGLDQRYVACDKKIQSFPRHGSWNPPLTSVAKAKLDGAERILRPILKLIAAGLKCCSRVTLLAEALPANYRDVANKREILCEKLVKLETDVRVCSEGVCKLIK